MRPGRGIAAEAIVEILVATDRLRLRQWVPADREPFARLNGDRGSCAAGDTRRHQ